MIDNTLAKLSRDLIAATDTLASEDFLTRQARFVEIEAERAALAESLETDEAAVMAAQSALQAHLMASATFAAPEPEIAASDVPEPVIEHAPGWAGIFAEQQADEFSSSRANGAYPEE